MTVLLLNSGTGTRMGNLTENIPKCMVEISAGETLLSRQLKQIVKKNIKNIVITTGNFDLKIQNYCKTLNLPLNYKFVLNPKYATTNYIYSIFLAHEYLKDNIILMHGDLVFENAVLDLVYSHNTSCMVVSTDNPLPDKDFKAVIETDKITKIGIEYFNNAVAAQPLYKFNHDDFILWLDKITLYCKNGSTDCYAETALNEILNIITLYPLDIKEMFCSEIDTPEDLKNVTSFLGNL